MPHARPRRRPERVARAPGSHPRPAPPGRRRDAGPGATRTTGAAAPQGGFEAPSGHDAYAVELEHAAFALPTSAESAEGPLPGGRPPPPPRRRNPGRNRHVPRAGRNRPGLQGALHAAHPARLAGAQPPAAATGDQPPDQLPTSWPTGWRSGRRQLPPAGGGTRPGKGPKVPTPPPFGRRPPPARAAAQRMNSISW